MPRRILVVDDHGPSREGLRRWLLGAGWQAETASDGWQALKRIKEGRFDVAIIDLDLPPVHGVAVSGWDLVRIFRAFNPSISIIVLSAEGGEDVKVRADQLRVSWLLEKPINSSQLHGILRALGVSAVAQEVTTRRGQSG